MSVDLLLAVCSVPLLAAVATDAAAQGNAASAAHRGTYERVTVHGPSLEGNLLGEPADRPVSVYLPASYAESPNRRYPVLYLLHGFTDTDERWYGTPGTHFVNVPTAVDRAVVAGASEMIVVTPNAFTTFECSMYSSSVATGDWEGFVAKDLVAYVDAHYRTLPTRASRGLAGHSMGGYGVMRIGMKYPDVFIGLYSLSPCCMAPNMTPSPEAMSRAGGVRTATDIASVDFGTKAMLASAAAWSPNPLRPPLFLDLPIIQGQAIPETIAKWAANAPLTMVHQYLPSLRSFKAIALDAGDEDTGIAATVRTLSGILESYGIDHVAEIYPGDHLNRVEERLTVHVLPFFSATLEVE